MMYKPLYVVFDPLTLYSILHINDSKHLTFWFLRESWESAKDKAKKIGAVEWRSTHQEGEMKGLSGHE